MIPLETRTSIDATIDRSLRRIGARAGELGPGFGALADAIARAATGGKRFRPALVVASYRAFGGDEDLPAGVLPVAAAFELLHTAFVVHDDVIDHDTVRRGIPNVAGEFRMRARETVRMPRAQPSSATPQRSWPAIFCCTKPHA